LVSAVAVIAAVLGAGVAAGLLLLAYGLRRIPRGQPSHRPPRLTREQVVRLAACLAVAAVVGLLTRWPVGAVLAGVAAWTLPRQLGADHSQKRALARTEAVASWAEMLRDNLSAAAGLEQAIIAAGDVAPAAIRDEATQLAASIRSGMRLPEALATFREQLADPTGDLVVRALGQAAHRQASKLADLLTELAEVARKRTAVRLRVAAGRARVRTSARVVTATTVVFAAGLAALNRPYLASYDTATGQLVLLLIGVLFAAGFAGLTRLGRVGDAPTPVRVAPDNRELP
jgi:Flp pilus assembly protein TadB